jgi:hypothetical protein
MKNIVFTLSLFTLVQLYSLGNAFAQVSINDIKGNKLRNTEGYDGIEGSAYFYPEWKSGEVIFASGKQAKMDFLKYDLVEDRVFFSDESKKAEYNFTEPVRAFNISGAVFQNNFPAIGNLNKDSYFQVIAKGKSSLLKKQETVIGERTQVGLPPGRYFKKMLKYYVFDGQKMAVVKIDAKSLAEVLNIKKEQIEQYAKEKDLNLKDDLGLKSVFEYFSK